jgi:SPP1 family holin
MSEKTKAIIRLLVALVPVLNIVLTALGKSPLPFTQEEVNAGLSSVVAVLGLIWAWWKNNNITLEAQTGQKIIDKMKAGRNKVGGEGDPLEVQ